MYFKLLIILIILSCYLPHVTSAYAQDDQAVFVQQGHVNDTIMKLCFSQDGEYILSAGSDNLVKIWYEPNGREFKTLTGRGWPLAFSTNGQYVFFKDQARDLTKLWDTETDREVVTFKGNNHPGAAAISPDNRTVLTSESDREGMILKLWDIATGRAVRVFNGHHTGGTYTIAFSQDAKHVLTGSRDKTVKLWDVASGNFLP
jgi:WD40 repeat protein